ncbi:hypothetical protein RugamoR57_09410 [Duganella caerulea]
MSRTGRFGPAQGPADKDGDHVFWIYAAEDDATAVWEGRFCKSLATLPGRFVFTGAARRGVIAQLSFGEPLRLFDLSGEAASKLGIYDELRSPNYSWCQCLGREIDQIIKEYQGAVHGFAYPSRRSPGKVAYVISSRVRDVLASQLTMAAHPFVGSDEYLKLLADPCYIRPEAL